MRTSQITTGATALVILTADSQRKSVTIRPVSNDIYISTFQNECNSSDGFLIPENTFLTLSIPEDVPQHELWALRNGTPNATIYIMEEFKKIGKGIRNI